MLGGAGGRGLVRAGQRLDHFVARGLGPGRQRHPARHHAWGLGFELQHHALGDLGADAGRGLNRARIAKGDRAGHPFHAKGAQNRQRRLGPHPLHRGQQPVPFLFQQCSKAEQLQQILAHQQFGIKRHRLARRGQGGQGAIRDMDDIAYPAHVDQHVIRPAIVDPPGNLADHPAALFIAAANRPADCR